MTRLRRSTLAAVLVPALFLAACSAAAPASPASPTVPGSATPPAASSPITAAPPIGITPMPPVTAPAPGGGESVPGNPGDGSTVTSPPGNGGGAVPDPQPTMVSPVAGLTGIHPINVAQVIPAVNGRDVAVRLAWWSGVAPCSVFAGVNVVRDGTTFTLTVREGAAQQGVACSEIAMYKATIVDLGSLDPGVYTIKASGDVPATQVTVAG